MLHPGIGIDLLKFKLIHRLFLWKGFPYVFQGLTLVIFIFLAVFGWNLYPPVGVEDKLFAKANLVNLLIWGLWWPLMIIAAVFLGRAWCMVCPLELAANLAERLGRKLNVPQRSLAKWLRSGALLVGLYALIQLLVAGVHLHRIPAYTSIFLWSLLLGAAVVGFFFKDRAFCRGFCPVGMLLNVYGRGGMLAVRPASVQTCQSCDQKNCVLAGNRLKSDRRSCPSLLNPAKLNSNSDCLVCGQCIKACDSRENMRLFLRRPFHSRDSREAAASWPITIFVMLVSGFVTYELCAESPSTQQVFLWLPQTASGLWNAGSFSNWIKGVWTLFIFPLLLWSIALGIYRLFNRNEKLLESWRKLALPMAVLVSAGHIAKAAAKLASWGGFLPLAFRDPSGIETVNFIVQKSMIMPEALLSKPTVSWIGLIMILSGLFFALRETRLAGLGRHTLHYFPLIALAGLFAWIVWEW